LRTPHAAPPDADRALSLTASLERELAAGLPRLAGAHITGTVPVREVLLNELIGELVAPGAPAPVLRLLDGNQFTLDAVLWILPFQVHATLVSVDLDLNVTIALHGHVLKRSALSIAARRLPFVRSGPGGSLIIAAGDVPAVARYRHVWRHLTHLGVRTYAGRLVCEFAFSR
jgi:hypothetical protein